MDVDAAPEEDPEPEDPEPEDDEPDDEPEPEDAPESEDAPEPVSDLDSEVLESDDPPPFTAPARLSVR